MQTDLLVVKSLIDAIIRDPSTFNPTICGTEIDYGPINTMFKLKGPLRFGVSTQKESPGWLSHNGYTFVKRCTTQRRPYTIKDDKTLWVWTCVESPSQHDFDAKVVQVVRKRSESLYLEASTLPSTAERSSRQKGSNVARGTQTELSWCSECDTFHSRSSYHPLKSPLEQPAPACAEQLMEDAPDNELAIAQLHQMSETRTTSHCSTPRDPDMPPFWSVRSSHFENPTVASFSSHLSAFSPLNSLRK